MDVVDNAREVPRGRYELVHLREWRECARLSLQAFAERSGRSVPSTLAIEHGRRKANGTSVAMYAAALGIPVLVLLSYAPTDLEAHEYAIELFRQGKAVREEMLARRRERRRNTLAHRANTLTSDISSGHYARAV